MGKEYSCGLYSETILSLPLLLGSLKTLNRSVAGRVWVSSVMDT